jgi:hypothetical protein
VLYSNDDEGRIFPMDPNHGLNGVGAVLCYVNGTNGEFDKISQIVVS